MRHASTPVGYATGDTEEKRFFRPADTSVVYRRAFLATVGVFVPPTTGCVARFRGEQSPVVLRAMRARGNETDVRCSLSASFLADHPPLSQAIAGASGRELYEWERVGVSEQTAQDVAEALHQHCEENSGRARGLYHYDGQYYFVSITPRGTGTAGMDH